MKKNNQGEADAIFTFLTCDFGKLTFAVKAVRKITSKLRPGLQPFSLIYFEFVPGKTNKIVTEAITIKNFSGIKDDLKNLQAGFYIRRLLDKFLRENEKDENIWNLTIAILEQLEHLKQNHLLLSALLRYFEFRLVKALGYMPEFFICIICGKKIKEENNFLSFADGGLICPRCQGVISQKSSSNKEYNRTFCQTDNKMIGSQIIKILRLFFAKDFDFVKRLKLKKENLEELKKISKGILEHILEERINLV